MCYSSMECWHCGEWFAKQANRGEFEDCPFCKKGFGQLSVEAQRAVKVTLAPFFEVPQLKQVA